MIEDRRGKLSLGESSLGRVLVHRFDCEIVKVIPGNSSATGSIDAQFGPPKFGAKLCVNLSLMQ